MSLPPTHTPVFPKGALFSRLLGSKRGRTAWEIVNDGKSQRIKISVLKKANYDIFESYKSVSTFYILTLAAFCFLFSVMSSVFPFSLNFILFYLSVFLLFTIFFIELVYRQMFCQLLALT